jgi:xanthine dehydrogenase YagS FAD-binding subunit
MNAVLGGGPDCIAAYAGDLAVALAALDARIEIIGAQGTRAIALEELHRLPGATPAIETTLAPGELITAVMISAERFAAHSHYLKLRDRASFEFALVSAAVALDIDGGLVREARVAVGGVATKPWRLRQVEAALAGKAPGGDSFSVAAEQAGDGTAPRPGNAFKVELMKRAVERALRVAGGIA